MESLNGQTPFRRGSAGLSTMSRRDWPDRFWSIGFEGRTFLTEDEWKAFLRRPPVRRGYIKFQKIRGKAQGAMCAVCKLAGSDSNPLQAAHRINALNGVRYFALTPDFLDNPKRLVWAHRQECNRKVELSFSETMAYMWRSGIRKLPAFLPKTVHSAWKAFRRGSRP